jgi:hypothetical protein
MVLNSLLVLVVNLAFGPHWKKDDEDIADGCSVFFRCKSQSDVDPTEVMTLFDVDQAGLVFSHG